MYAVSFLPIPVSVLSYVLGLQLFGKSKSIEETQPLLLQEAAVVAKQAEAS